MTRRPSGSTGAETRSPYAWLLRAAGGGGIDIAVDVVGDEVVVEVRNALPPGPDDRGGAGHSIGLQATRERVQASTGGRGGVESVREGEAVGARWRGRWGGIGRAWGRARGCQYGSI